MSRRRTARRTATSSIPQGASAGVIVWPDILGLRPAFRQMGKRLAEAGYAVLVVNPFYRQKKAPVVPAGASFADPGDARHRDAAGAGAECHDACHRRQGVRRVPRQPGGGRQETEDRHDRLLHGRPDRDADGGGGSRSDRRRCIIPWRRAGDQGTRQPAPAHPDDEGALPVRRRGERRSAGAGREERPSRHFAKAKLPAEIEVYAGAAHGWCPPDSAVYNEKQAERAWARLLVLFKEALA